ncbi:MAG: hypothetical protein AABY22_05090 [Nanoarchaeota archaeon]
MKKCSRCKIEKQLFEFHKNKAAKDGLQFHCKDCQKKCRKPYGILHKKELNQYSIRYRQQHKEYFKQYDKQYRKTAKGRFNEYKSSAKRFGRLFEIDFEFAKKLFFSDCYFCSAKPNPVNGIDRLNNDLDYIKDNCVSCCIRCNRVKMNYSVEETLFHLQKMVETMKNNEIKK